MRILFDTNIILHHLRNDLPMVHFIRQHYQPFNGTNEALISIVSVGELESLAIRSHWGGTRYQKLQDFLQRFLIIVDFGILIGWFCALPINIPKSNSLHS